MKYRSELLCGAPKAACLDIQPLKQGGATSGVVGDWGGVRREQSISPGCTVAGECFI